MESDRTLPYGRQWVDEADYEAVRESLQGDFLTTGPTVARFESELAAKTGALGATAVNSGTAALHCAYAAVGLGPGDVVVTTPITFAATANVALSLGAEVRFADVDPETGLIDPQAVEHLLDGRTKVVAPVDYAGLPADYDALTRLSKSHGLKLVTDAAHSLGAHYKGHPVGKFADAATLSFHPVKAITTGEGGAVVSNDPEILEGCRRFRSHGMSKPDRVLEREGAWYYQIEEEGLNYRLTDFQCALGISQLKKLDSFLARRRAIVEKYQRALASFSSVKVPVEPADRRSAWHLFVLRLSEPDSSLRRRFFERLHGLGLRAQVHYIPVYWQPRYQALGFCRGLCPRAEAFYDSIVSLPLFPAMTDSDVDFSIERTVQAIREVLE